MPGAIDVWCNLFTAAAIQKYWLETKELAEIVSWWRLEERMRGYSPKDFVALMDEVGVEKVCIPAIRMRSFQSGEMLWDMSLKEVANVMQAYPERFLGLVGINPLKRMEGVRELEMAVRELGFKGAHIHAYGFGLPINDRAFFPFYAKCVELDVPVEMQVGHSAEPMPSALARPILIDDIALYFPELRIIGGHTGWPWGEEMIAMAWKHRNVYIATSAHAPRYWDPSLVRFINTRGQDKVLYGTDYPVLGHKESLEQIEALNLRDEPKRKLLSDNALRVFKL